MLHLLAIASSANVELKLDDFTRIGKRVPVLADLRPSGRYSMSELVAIGGIQPLMKTLLDAGLLHGDCLTVTGATLAENLRNVAAYPEGQQIVRPLGDPIKKDSHLVVLYGNLAPEGAVAKITGKEGLRFKGKARVFNSEEDALQGHPARQGKGRRRGGHPLRRPQGRPGDARDVKSHERHHRQGTGKGGGPDHRWALLGRQSRLRGRPLSPEAALGGLLALVKTGDEITIDAVRREITLHVSGAELKRRRASWKAPKPYARRGALAKYSWEVSSATLGAVTDLPRVPSHAAKNQ